MVASHWVYGNYNDKTYEVIRYYNVVSKMLVLKLLIKIVLLYLHLSIT